MTHEDTADSFRVSAAPDLEVLRPYGVRCRAWKTSYPAVPMSLRRHGGPRCMTTTLLNLHRANAEHTQRLRRLGRR